MLRQRQALATPRREARARTPRTWLAVEVLQPEDVRQPPRAAIASKKARITSSTKAGSTTGRHER